MPDQLEEKNIKNTPGTAGGPGGRDRKLAIKGRKNVRKSVFFHKKNENYLTIFLLLQISSSYAKLLRETNFQPREIPRSRSKAKDGGEKRKSKSW